MTAPRRAPRRAPRVAAGTLARALLVAAVVAACGPADQTRATASPGPAQLASLPVATVRIGSLDLQVAVADSEGERARGLAGILDLGSLDGLLFAFPADVDTSFTMRGTLLPLDIAFIGGDGRVIDVQSMSVCETGPCPPYAAPTPYRWALETPRGGLPGVREGDPFSLQP